MNAKIPEIPNLSDIQKLIFPTTRWIEDRYELSNEILDKHEDYMRTDILGVNKRYLPYPREKIMYKLNMLSRVSEYFSSNGIGFDKFNGLPPSRINIFKSYEFSTLFLWNILISLIEKGSDAIKFIDEKNFYDKYKKLIASVFKKYPKLTGILISEVDLHYPGNKFFDIAMANDEVDFDADHSDEYVNDEKADEFNKWILKWCSKADSHDKMRVNNWFITNKSHKQIFAEVHKVVGNTHKFNCRLALFVERLFNNEDCDYFFSKSGFETKESLFLAYFEKLTMFDDETKKNFIHKYLVK